MENRERDRVSQRTSPTDAGDLNRQTEERKGRDDGSSVEFGKNIGRSEELDANTDQGGTMNKDKTQQDNLGNLGNESSRRSGGESGYGSSGGRSGSGGSMGGGSSTGNSGISGGQSGSMGKRSGNQDSSQQDKDGSGNWGGGSDQL